MIDLRQLRYFIAVADGLNVSRAAGILNISQSALSRQIQDLENQLGFALFERIGKRLVLTGEGERLLPRACNLLEEAAAFTALGDSMAAGHIGFLRIAASPQTIASLISPVLMSFRQRYPGIEITLVEGANESLLELIRKGAVHLVVASPSDGHDLSCQDLFDARLLALMPRDDPRSALPSMPVCEIANDPLLVLDRGFMTRELFDRSCTAAGIRPRIFLESSSPYTLIALAREGHGTAILSSSASSGLTEDRVVPLTLEGRPIRQMVSAVWNPKRHQPPGFSYLLELLAHQAAERLVTKSLSSPLIGYD